MFYSFTVFQSRSLGLPRWLSGKESAFPWRRLGFDPWVAEIPWRRKWKPTPVFLPGESHEGGAWRLVVHGVSQSWEQASNGAWSRTWLSDGTELNWRGYTVSPQIDREFLLHLWEKSQAGLRNHPVLCAFCSWATLRSYPSACHAVSFSETWGPGQDSSHLLGFNLCDLQNQSSWIWCKFRIVAFKD